MTEEERKKAKEAAISAGVGLRGESPADKVAESLAPPMWITFTSNRRQNYSVPCCRNTSASRFSAALLESVAAEHRRAHDRHGFRHQQRHRT